MKSKSRFGFLRWATAAIVAAGAITFATSDTFAYHRRIFVSFYSSGNCAQGGSTVYRGVGQAFDASGNLICEVGVSTFSGNTNFANAECVPNLPSFVPSWIVGRAFEYNGSTGDYGALLCDGGLVSWGGGGSSSCSMTTAAGCFLNPSASHN